MPAAGASQQNLDGQVFWLTARDDPGRPSRLVAVACVPRDLADYSGGPATDLHRLPYYPPSSGSPAGGTCRGESLEPAVRDMSRMAPEGEPGLEWMFLGTASAPGSAASASRAASTARWAFNASSGLPTLPVSPASSKFVAAVSPRVARV
jgi:hypothetical protein